VAVLGASNYPPMPRRSPPKTRRLGSPPTCTPSKRWAACRGPSSPTTWPRRSKEARRYEPDINASYQEMVAYYRVAIIPARARKPQGQAQRQQWRAARRKMGARQLRNRRSYSLGETNAEVSELVAWLNDRPFTKMPGRRRQLLEEPERPVMRPLAATRYSYGA